MNKLYVEASASIEARPEDVYGLIADYHKGHPRILPKSFRNLVVEKGGYGEGTVISFRVRVMGVEQGMRMEIREPEPGRVLVEREITPKKGITTTFSFTPEKEGQKTLLKIATEKECGAGIQGQVEKWMLPAMLRNTYKKELQLVQAIFVKEKVLN